MSKQLSSMVWDYVVFALFIIVSTIYPIWGEIRSKKGKQTKANYVFASGKVSMFAMMLSIARGTLGVRAFIGYPSELFYRGSGMWETLYGLLNAYPVVIFVFVPVYCSLGITSVYQYLDLRFNSRLVRRLASASFILRNILSLGITVYTPCVALNTVVGVPYWASLIAMTGISILFTLLGGLKAAITADAIQGLTIILVSIGVIFQGVYETGSISKVYNVNNDNGRLKFLEFTGDITTRVDTLSAWAGQLFISMSILGCQQNLVQRYLSMKSEKEVRNTLMANMPFITVLFSLSWIVGMVIYSTYYMCDPMEAGYINKMDEILPFFVEDKLSYVPGCLGIFMATLFNGALCLNVSNLNSLATVTWEDFISHMPRFKEMIDKQQLSMIKYIGVIYAFIIMGIAFSVGFLSGVIESAMLTSSATTGPLVGVFLLAMLVPVANWKGAAAGMISSHILTIIITAGSFTVKKPPSELLSTSTEGCTNTTFSPWITKSDTSWLVQSSPVEIGWNNGENSFLLPQKPAVFERSATDTLFSISYMYYSIIGTFVTLIIGILVSWITSSESDRYDETLLHPLVLKISKHFSKQHNVVVDSTESDRKHKSENINHGFIADDIITVDNNCSTRKITNASLQMHNKTDKMDNIQLSPIGLLSSANNNNNSKKNAIEIEEPIEKYRQLNDV